MVSAKPQAAFVATFDIRLRTLNSSGDTIAGFTN